jgi:hypothetical protein
MKGKGGEGGGLRVKLVGCSKDKIRVKDLGDSKIKVFFEILFIKRCKILDDEDTYGKNYAILLLPQSFFLT